VSRRLYLAAVCCCVFTALLFFFPLGTLAGAPNAPDLQLACPSNQLTATLSGTNQVPPNASTATGSATLTINATTGQITVNMTVFGLSSNATASHIHTGVAGVNGAVLVPFVGIPAATSFTYSMINTTTPANASNILANPAGFYVNVHTVNLAGGEIRGQLSCVVAPASIPAASAARDVPEADPLLLVGGGLGGLATWLGWQRHKRRKP
jgi:CHRD domain-containing protein